MRARRLFLVALAYLTGAWLVDLLLRELVPVLVLPPLFMPLARALLLLGLVATLAAAWTYEGGRQ